MPQNHPVFQAFQHDDGAESAESLTSDCPHIVVGRERADDEAVMRASYRQLPTVQVVATARYDQEGICSSGGMSSAGGMYSSHQHLRPCHPYCTVALPYLMMALPRAASPNASQQ